jgi:hypothetical protein
LVLLFPLYPVEATEPLRETARRKEDGADANNNLCQNMKELNGVMVAMFSLVLLCRAQPEGTNLWNFVPTDNDWGGDIQVAVAYDGTVYLKSGTNLHALTPWGGVKWTRPCPTVVKSTIAVAADATVYLPSQSGLHAFNPNGTTNWVFPYVGPGYNCGPAIGVDGTIYIPCQWTNSQAKLVAIAPNGIAKWSYDLSSPFTWPTVGPDGTVYLLNKAIAPDGTLRWSFPPGYESYSWRAIARDGGLYYFSDQGVTALWPNGTIKWACSFASYYGQIVVGSAGSLFFSYSTNLYALSPDGTTNWAYNAEEGLGPPSIDNGGHILVPGYTNVYCLNTDGSLRWKTPLGATPLNWPVVGPEGNIYVTVYERPASSPDVTKLCVFKGSSGLNNAAWPMVMGNHRNSGRRDQWWLSANKGAVTQSVDVTLHAEVGLQCRIECSADMQTWLTLCSVNCTNASTRIPSALGTNAQEFYRALAP